MAYISYAWNKMSTEDVRTSFSPNSQYNWIIHGLSSSFVFLLWILKENKCILLSKLNIYLYRFIIQATKWHYSQWTFANVFNSFRMPIAQIEKSWKIFHLEHKTRATIWNEIDLSICVKWMMYLRAKSHSMFGCNEKKTKQQIRKTIINIRWWLKHITTASSSSCATHVIAICFATQNVCFVVHVFVFCHRCHKIHHQMCVTRVFRITGEMGVHFIVFRTHFHLLRSN